MTTTVGRASRFSMAIGGGALIAHGLGARVRAAVFVLASLILVAPAAGGLPPCVHPSALGLVHFVTPLEEVADAIVVLKPSVDYPMFTGAERVIEGEIERVEKGVPPQTIVTTAQSLWAGLRAGVPARLFLKKFQTRDAHYVIGVSSSPNRPPDTSIKVSASQRVTNTRSTILIEGLVTALDGQEQFPMDVYVWLARPNGDPVWLTGNVLMPTMTVSAAPIPFLVRAPEKTIGFGVTYRFAPDDPPGWYVLHGVVVMPIPGADPRNPCHWLDTSTFPLLVIEPESP